MQIVVVDSASTDSTAAVVLQHRQEDERIELVQVDHAGIPTALNHGLAGLAAAGLCGSTRTRPYPRTTSARRSPACGRAAGAAWGVARTASDAPLQDGPWRSRCPAGSRWGARPITSAPDLRRSTTCRSAPTRWLSSASWAGGTRGWPQTRTSSSTTGSAGPVAGCCSTLNWSSPGTVGSRSATCSGSTTGTAAARWTWPCCTPTRWEPDTSRPRCSSCTWGGAVPVGLRHPRWAQAMLAPYVVALVAESVRLAPRLDRRSERLACPWRSRRCTSAGDSASGRASVVYGPFRVASDRGDLGVPSQWLDVRPGGEDVGAYTSESGQRGLKLVVQAQPSLFLETLTGALTATGHLVRGATPNAGTVPELVTKLAPDLCILHDAEPACCLAAARDVREQAPAVKLLVISTGRIRRPDVPTTSTSSTPCSARPAPSRAWGPCCAGWPGAGGP